MKPIRNICLALLCILPMASCGTFHHVRWATQESSAYAESTWPLSRDFVKPFWTVVGFPVVVVWDVVTLPFQAISGVYPYGDNYMVPGEAEMGI